MTKAYQVLEMLLPDGGWIINGNEYEGIEFINCKPITKKEFIDGFTKFDAYQAKKDADNGNTKLAILDRLGITEEEARILLGGN